MSGTVSASLAHYAYGVTVINQSTYHRLGTQITAGKTYTGAIVLTVK